jgi:general secretion pathway protein E
LATLERALRLQQESGERLGALLVTLGVVAQRDVADALAAQLALPLVDAASYPEFPILEERVSTRFLREMRVLPAARGRRRSRARHGRSHRGTRSAPLQIGDGAHRPADGGDPERASRARDRAPLRNRQVAQSLVIGDVETRVDDLDFEADVQQLKDLASEAPVIRLVSVIITNALDMRASDIHVEPFESRLAVRYRVDGVLHDSRVAAKAASPPR